MTDRYFSLGYIAGTPYTRWAVLRAGFFVGVQISRPDGVEVDRPTHLRWRQQTASEVEIKRYRINEQPPRNGEQARRPVWKRAGRTAATEAVP